MVSILNILNFFRKLFKPRRLARYNVRNGALVMVEPGVRMFQIIDINMKGAAFVYEGRPEEIETSGALMLIAGEMSPQRVKFDTVYDIPITGYSRSPERKFRRRGVKFKWMSVMDQVELNKFIKEVSIFIA